MTIGDSLPPKQRRELIKRTLVPGTIIHLLYPHAKPKPKNKFFLIVDVTPDPVLFIINSNPHVFIQSRHPGSQVKLEPKDYSFFNRPCYIDCSTPVYTFSMTDIVEAIVGNYRDRKMEINGQTKVEVVRAISNNRTLSVVEKTKLIRSLTS